MVIIKLMVGYAQISCSFRRSVPTLKCKYTQFRCRGKKYKLKGIKLY